MWIRKSTDGTISVLEKRKTGCATPDAGKFLFLLLVPNCLVSVYLLQFLFVGNKIQVKRASPVKALGVIQSPVFEGRGT